MNWLQSHYNLICHAHGDTEVFRNKSGTGRFPKTRLFEHTNAQVSQHYSSDLSRLAELPTLLSLRRFRRKRETLNAGVLEPPGPRL